MERKYSIDLLRILSAAAVILIHVISSPIAGSYVAINSELSINLNRIHALMNWSVPVFFMITGYCLQKKQEVTYRYCFAHVLKYISVLFTVGLAYAVLKEIFIAKTINISVLIQAILKVLEGDSWYHMWFVYDIIGIYLVMPIIHLFIQKEERNAIILTVMLFVFNIILPTFDKYFSLGINIPFGGYLFYVCFGGTIARLKVSRGFSVCILLLGLLSAVWIFFGIANFRFGYNHLAVCAMAMGIFLMISQMKIKANKFTVNISKCTWGIYLIHPFFIYVATELLKIEVLLPNAFVNLLLWLIIISIVSFFTTYVLRKLPLIKNLF